MRLIDADEYEKRIKPYDTEDKMDKALYNFAHYHLVTTPSERLEITEEEWRQIKKLRSYHNGSYAKLLDKMMASVQPERKRGKWIEYNATGKKQWMCSECCAEEKNPKVARFCYWWGADMRGELDE